MNTPLQRIRNERALTLAEVARQLDTDKAHYLRIERGHAKTYCLNGVPFKAQIMRASPELARKIADFFGNAVSIDQILFPEKYCPEVLEKLNEARDAITATQAERIAPEPATEVA